MADGQVKTNAEEVKELEDKVLSDQLGEEVKDGKIVEKEEPAKETPKEEPKETADEKSARERDEKGRFVKKEDVDALKAELKDEVTKETTEKITKALNSKEEGEGEQVSVYRQKAEEFMTAQRALGKEPTWEDAFAFLAENTTKMAIEGIKAEQEQAKQTEAETQKKLEEGQQVRKEEFNKYIDGQLDDLYASGKLPPVKNADGSENEYGVNARKGLFQKMQDVNVERVKNNQSPIYSLKEIFYEHYELPAKQVSGADAPISAGRGGQSVDNSKETFTNEEIRNKSFIELAQEGMKNN